MNRDSVAWHGPMPALVTPFGADGAIDAKLFARNIELQLSTARPASSSADAPASSGR